MKLTKTGILIFTMAFAVFAFTACSADPAPSGSEASASQAESSVGLEEEVETIGNPTPDDFQGEDIFM